MSVTPKKLLLMNGQSPGDVVMLTAAVRDLHRNHPGRFLTDVRTSCPDLWQHNPWLTPLDPLAPDVQRLACQYPLIQESNQRPVHFLEGFVEYLSEELKLKLKLTEFRGDIHLSEEEMSRPSVIETLTGRDDPFWIIVAGGKYDLTIKWWHRRRWQAVVNQLKDDITFVQVGESGHFHPPLNGVIDLRGKTSLRELIHLVYHAAGILCPVTCLMHLAAAVPTRPDRPRSRPCVVVAGGREPPHWEAYPTHQFIHTVGALPCCETSGCWRARIVPLGDGQDLDQEKALCQDVVNGLPRCMSLITPEAVVSRIQYYPSPDPVHLQNACHHPSETPLTGAFSQANAETEIERIP